MDYELNALNQPVGQVVQGWIAPSCPGREPMEGRLCRLEPLDAARHADELFDATSLDTSGRSWTYLPYGPFASPEAYDGWLHAPAWATIRCSSPSSTLGTGRATGLASYLRIAPDDRLDRGGTSPVLAGAAAHHGRHRGDVPDDAPCPGRARLPALRVEVRRPERDVADAPPSGSASASRGSSARPRSTRAATATRPGSRCSTPSGPRWTRLPALAGPGELRRRGPAAFIVVCPDGADPEETRIAGALALPARGKCSLRLIDRPILRSHPRAFTSREGRLVRTERSFHHGTWGRAFLCRWHEGTVRGVHRRRASRPSQAAKRARSIMRPAHRPAAGQSSPFTTAGNRGSAFATRY